MNQASDRTKLRRLQNRILARKGLVLCGSEFTAALHSRGKAVYTGASRYGQGDVTAYGDVTALACSDSRAVALMRDGTLRLPAPVDTRLSDLAHVRAVSCSDTHIAALLGNGRVTVGYCDGSHAADTAEWPAVLDVVCGKGFTAGLTLHGRVLVAGGGPRLRYAVSRWTDVAGLFADAEGEHLYAITVDGLLLSTAHLSRAVRSWRNLIYMAASGKRILAVTATGHLYATCPAPDVTMNQAGFAACAVSPRHAVALSRDGKVFAVGKNEFGQCDTQRFGVLFEGFDELLADRRATMLRVIAEEKTYQIRLAEASRYGTRMVCGPRFTACIAADGRVVTSAGFGKAKQWSSVRALACGNAHLVALHEGGHVSADGNDTDGCTAVDGWSGVKCVAAGKYHTLGVTEDGRVLFCGRNDKGQGDVTDWNGIRRVYAADTYTVGLGYDGTLRLAGQPPFGVDLMDGNWHHPTDLAVTNTHMAILCADGTVRSTRRIPASDKPGDGEVWDTCGFHRVRSIAAGEGFTVALGYGGRVMAAGENDLVVKAVGDWSGVVSVACGRDYVLGLTADGRVLSAGELRVERDPAETSYTPHPVTGYLRETPDTTSWRDVIALTAGPDHAVAMTREGAVLTTGLDSDGQCSAMTHVTLFRDTRQLYGYGRYRKLSECGVMTSQETDEEKHTVKEDSTLIPFARFSAHLRGDTEAILSRLAGDDDRLTVLNPDQPTPVAYTYRYETAEQIADTLKRPVRSVTAFGEGTLFIHTDGTARLRGDLTPDAPLTTLPSKLGDSPFYPVTRAAAGGKHYAVLLADGTVRAFGDNDRGQCDTGDWKNITAIAAGDSHTVGLRADGTAVATGARRRDSGKSRGVAHLPRANPCAVEDWRNMTRVTCAGDLTVGLTADGRVRAVGSSHYGQCNTEGWRGVVSVATSGNHTVALFADGHVEAVGLNQSGECRTESWYHVVQIAVMPELTLGLRSDGRVLAAGRHNAVLNTLDSVRAMACFGSRRQVFVMADGTLRIHIRGSEFLPEPLGDLRVFTPSVRYSALDRAVTRSVPAVTARRALGTFAVGMVHTLTLGEEGTVTATGADDSGQCGIAAYAGATQVAAGPYHSAAILADGSLVITGRNPDGRCDFRTLNRELDTVGVSAEESRHGAVPAPGDPDPTLLPYAWLQVACGHEHTAALRSDGRVYAVGANPDGRCDTRQWRDVDYVACGVRHTVALRSDGTCVATGDNRCGQCDVSLWKHIVMVAAGEFHTVGLRADGRVEVAGDNRKGQCRAEDLRDVISVACLPEATLCVRADGRVTVRGGDGEPDKAVEALREVVAIHTCEHRVAALTTDRRVILLP